MRAGGGGELGAQLGDVSILGVSAFYHDSAAAVLVGGRLVAAAQEERFSRIKFDRRFPARAVSYCLGEAGLVPAELDYVVFYERPLRTFARLLTAHALAAPRGVGTFEASLDRWLRWRLNCDESIRGQLPGFEGDVLFVPHHLSHAAAAFFPSPFEEAAVLTVDAVGEWSTTTIGLGSGNSVKTLEELRFPDSLGLLYSAFTRYLGFRVNSGEYKMMGLAPYGSPRYADVIRKEIVALAPDGSFSLNRAYFDFCSEDQMTVARFDRLFGGPPREEGETIVQRHMDIAASIQVVTEDALLALARRAQRETGKRRLCLGGGVALNCVGASRILRDGPFEEVFILPAPGDAGGAVGAALLAWHHVLHAPRQAEASLRFSAFLGPAFDDDEIRSRLEGFGAVMQTLPNEEQLVTAAARLLADGKVVGWFQGRMEFGPRALGARSILADPRRPEMQAELNQKVKFRESFRPFAPAVLEERAADYFVIDRPSPYMLFTAPIAPSQRIDNPRREALEGLGTLHVVRSRIPAVTHVDFSARLQTVGYDDNPLFHRLIAAFEALTGCPVLVNTSFNIRGEPIVCTPEEAYRCFMFSEMDALLLGNHLLLREQQPAMDGAAEYRQLVKSDSAAHGASRRAGPATWLRRLGLAVVLTPVGVFARFRRRLLGSRVQGGWRDASRCSGDLRSAF